jgi:hypothetical protein
MNLPSSLALSQSKFFQSRLGILLIALVGLAIAAGILLLRQREAKAPTLPTPATSPAAQSMARPVPKPVMYGPPAPAWARTDLKYGPPAPPEYLVHAAPAAGGSTVPSAPTVLAPSEPSVGSSAAAPNTGVATIPGSAAAVSGAPGQDVPIGVLTGETPKSVDASVLFARERYEYIGGGRRDPFQSLIEGKYQTQSGDGSLVDVGDIHLVGIMWGSSDKFALVEDSRGHGYVLRVGDPVLNGYISGISKSELQVVQNAFGESQAMSIRLHTKEGDKNATRN